ncbi:tripartite tricarboxylate transporter substrate binding protein [Stutzerimonas nitrititolerans]|uniref:tripartite tricarboxylate transporter substrate binding protein n=1 Tax=Stutzerimonas nitrititolerans TaxID=2482751 RepID=UPI0028ADB07D|nr:tripartite tricarboxylate transporter substrate binding protein [Stutzerimonas nitrititolerans]
MRRFSSAKQMCCGSILSAVLGFSLFSSSASAAEEFPKRNVQYIIPFVPGGESDISARLQQKYFEELTGKQLVIQYMAGGGGAVGWSQLNSMKPDGHTIMGTNLPQLILKPLDKAVGFKTADIKDFYYFHYSPDALVVNNDSPFKTLDDFVAAAKKMPGGVTLSGSGTQGANDVAKTSFDKLAGIVTTYIPFKGTGEAVTAVLGNQVSASWGYTTVAANHREKVRMLAVASEERHPMFPDVPTFKELGYDMLGGAYRGMAVPKDTPAETTEKLSGIFGKINQNPEFRKQMEELGFVLIDVPLPQVPAFLAKQTTAYTNAARAMGVLK